MSSTVDSRVVEMRFDNKEFERNAQQTLNTLQNLKRALDENVTADTFNELDRAARNVDLSGIEAGVEALSDRFSTLGIIGMRAIENITDGLMNRLSSAIHSVLGSITEGGLRRAQNIENARFQLQGMLDTEEEVEEVMKNASAAVDGTAFSLDAAANAASQFAASGVQAGDQMTQALQAISGVAATTNSSYEDIARVFTTVAGNGRLMGDQLLQLSVRGLNAAASLKDYFNGVRNGSIEASDAVKQMINSLVGATDAIEESGEDQYTAASKAISKEYTLKKKAYDAEYKALQKSLNAEYNAKKSEYDKSYKLLSDSLNAEVAAVQKANSKRIDEINEAYQADVDAYRKATNEKIALINEEYTESIKLIDEERYNKIKAIDDKIKAIQDEQKAEEKARELAEEEEQRSLLQRAVDEAKFSYTRQKAEEALAEFEAEVARKRAKEQRQEDIDKLQEQKSTINDEANLKKQEAAEKRSSAIEQVQEESSAKLAAMAKAHQEELATIREQQQAQIEAMRESNAERLAALKAQQTSELEVLREGQQAQLEAKRESQTEALSDLRESQSAQLAALKETLQKEGKLTSKFATDAEITEETIRDMVSKGLISFDLFSEAMATTFKDHAFDANKTFSGAMSNIRSALARTGAMFYTPFLEQGNPMIDFLNAIRVKVNEFNKALAPVAEFLTTFVLSLVPGLTKAVEKLDLGVVKVNDELQLSSDRLSAMQKIGVIIMNFVQSIMNIFKAIGSILKPIAEAFADIFNIDLTSILDGTDALRQFTEGLIASDKMAQGIKDTFKGVFSIFKLLGFVIKSVLQVFAPLTKLFGVGAEGVKSLTGSIGSVIEGFVNWVTTSETLQAVIQTLTGFISAFVDKVIVMKTIVSDAFDKAFDGFNIGSYFTEGFLKGLKKLIPDVITGIVNFAKNILESFKKVLGIHSPSTETEEAGEYFGQGFINGIKTIASSVVDAVISLAKSIVNAIKNFISRIDFVELATNLFDSAVNLINTLAEKIKEGIPVVIDSITELFTNIKDHIKNDKAGEESGESFIHAFLVGMKNAIKALGHAIADIFVTIFNAIREKMKDFSIKETYEAGKEAVVSFASAIINTIKQWLGPIGEAISSIFGEVDFGGLIAMAGGIAIIYEIIKLAKALKSVVNPFNAFSGALGGLNKTLKGFAFDLKAGAILKISAAIALLFGTFVVAYKFLDGDIDWKKFAGLAAVMAGLILSIGGIFLAISKIQANVAKGASSIYQVGSGIKALLKAEAWKGIIEVAVGALGNIILAIAGLVVLYKAYPEEMKSALKTFETIGGAMVGMILIFSLISSRLDTGSKAFNNTAVGFLALAASLYLMTMAVHKIVSLKINWKKDWDKLVLLGILFLMLTQVTKSLVKTSGKISENSGALNSGVIIAFCALVLVTLYAIKKLMNMGASLKKNAGQLLMIAVIFGMLLIVVNALVKMGQKSSGVLNMGSTIFGIAAFLIVTIAAIGILSFMPIKRYLKGILMLTGIFGALYLACMAAGKITKGDGWRSILALAAVVGVMVVALSVLSFIKWDKLLTSAGALSTVLSAFAFALQGAGSIKDWKGSMGSILMMIVAIGVIGYLMYKLQDIDWKSMLSLGGAISAVLIAMGDCMKDIGSIEGAYTKDTFGYYMSGLFAVFIIGLIISQMSQGVDWKAALALAGSIALVIEAMADTVGKMASIEGKFTSDIGSHYVMGLLSIAVIGAIIAVFSNMTDWKAALVLAGSIALVIEAMADAMGKISNGSKFELSDFGKYFAGLACIWAIAFVLSHFAHDIDIPSMLTLAGSISALLLAMGACLLMVSMGASDWQSAIVAGALMAEGVLAIWGIAEIMVNYADKIPDPSVLVQFGIGLAIVLLAIGACCLVAAGVGALGKVAIVGLGVIDAFIANLIIVLTALGGLAQIPGFTDIIEDSGAVLESIGIALGKFVGSIVNGIGQAIADLLPYLGDRLTDFMDNARPFFDGLKGIKGDQIKGAGAICEILLLLCAAELIDGLRGFVNFLFGNNTGTFGQKLVDFGSSFYEFSEKVKNVENPEKIKTIAEAMKDLVTVCSKIPNSGGWLEDIMGGNDIDDFGEKLVGFSESLKTIAKNFSDVTEAQLKKLPAVGEAMTSIAEMASKLPNSGGWAGSILGENDVDTFGYKLVRFSGSLKTIAKNFVDVTQQELNKFPHIAKAVKEIANMASELPNTGGLAGTLFGNNDVDDFGKRLVDFSLSLRQIAVNMQGRNFESSLDNLIAVMPKIKELADAVKNELGYSGVKQNWAEGFMKNFEQFADHLYNITQKTRSIQSSSLTPISSSITVLSRIKTSFETYFKEYVKTKIETFMTDLLYFTTFLSKVTGYAVSINYLSLTTLTLNFSTIRQIKTFFEQLGTYKEGKVTAFSTDLKNYTNALKSIAALDVAGILNGMTIMLATSNIVKSMADIFEANFKKYKSGYINGIIEDLKKYVNNMLVITNVANSVKWFQLSNVLSSANVANQIKEVFTKMKGYRQYTNEPFLKDLVKYTSTLAGIKDIAQQTTILNSLTDATRKFITIIPLLTSFNATNFTNFLKDLKKYGTDGVKNFVDQFNNSKDMVVKAVAKLFSYITQEISSKKTLMETSGKLIPKYLATGILSRDSINNVVNAARELVTKLYEAADKAYKSMEVAGNNAVIGFVNGMWDQINRGAVDRVGRALGEAAYDAARRALDEHSPSRKMNQVGSFAGEGFVNGLLKWVKAAATAGTDIGDSALDNLKEAISKVGSEIQNEDNFNPTITPILDLSNIEANADKIGGLLDFNKSIQLSSSAGLSFSGGLNNLLSNIQASIPDNSNDDVVEAINGLRSDMDTMNARLTNLQVVMDSGELVGAIIDPIDEQLGFNATLVERGVR